MISPRTLTRLSLSEEAVGAMAIVPSAVMKKFRILIVDNDDPFRQILKKTLRVFLPTVAIDEAAGGAEALQKVDDFLPDLIFMDIQLPGENGLKLTKKIKATHRNITILILSSYDKPAYREAASQYGADHFLLKTSLNHIDLEELVKSYQKAQESRNQRDPRESNC